MQISMKGIGRGLFAGAVVAVCVIGLDATANKAEAGKKPGGGGGGGGIVCLDVWLPVLCPDGNIYSNDCYALRAGQTGCVPWGGYYQ